MLLDCPDGGLRAEMPIRTLAEVLRVVHKEFCVAMAEENDEE